MAWGVCSLFGLRSSGGVGVEDRESEGFSSSCVEVEEVSSRFSSVRGVDGSVPLFGRVVSCAYGVEDLLRVGVR